MDGDSTDTENSRATTWKKDPEAVKENILTIATEEFAAHGLSGANINVIAQRTTASKRMIYYYFGDKEGLYCAVLERAHAALHQTEDMLDVAALDPVEALRRVVLTVFAAHANAPQFIRLVMVENIHNAEHLMKSGIVPELTRSILDQLEDVCARGKAAKLFRSGTDALHLHWMINAFSFYNISNRATFSASYGASLFGPEQQAVLQGRVADMVLAAVVIGYQPKSWD